MRLAWYLYQAAMASSLALAAPYLLVRRGSHYLETLPGRLGLRHGPELRGALWIHAVSVGEVGVAATLARALPEPLPLLVTTVTPTGQERAREIFADAGAGRPAAVAYLPFDLSIVVGPFLRRYAPAALVLVEGDYWPLVLHEAGRRGIPVAVVNGRVGERAFRRMARRPRLSRRLFFSDVRCFAVQSDEDRRRLTLSGAPAERIHVTGNLKFDTRPPAPQPELEDRVRRLAGGRPIFLAGSTMAGEEEQVVDAFRRIGGGERAFLVLAPRHPERWDAVADLMRERGIAAVRRSSLAGDEGSGLPAPAEVLLLDSLGELAALYGVADAAFIGGTLVPTGGHNPLEPAHFAVPVAVGPSMENFHQIAGEFERAAAWQRVEDCRGLAAAWDAWLADPAAARAVGGRAKELLLANRGALERTLELLAPILRPATERPANPRTPRC
jgi:3-deoxy-D-manno-octulosonic-acid transferase